MPLSPIASYLFLPDDIVRFTPDHLDRFVKAQATDWYRPLYDAVIEKGLNVILQVMKNLQTQLYVLRMQ